MNYRDVEVLVLDTRMTAKTRKHVQDCVAKGVCLCGCGKPATRRGLANNCYYAYRRVVQSMNKSDAARYTADLIKRGLLLAVQGVRVIKRNTPFDRVAR